jgi:hypothetical protein
MTEPLTHPHFSTAGSTPAQFVVGPIASMIDRIRGAISAGLLMTNRQMDGGAELDLV